MNKKETLKIQSEIINIFIREKLKPLDAIEIIAVVQANIYCNLILGVLQPDKPKEDK